MKLAQTIGCLVLGTLACLLFAPGVSAETLSAYEIIKKSESLMNQAKDSQSEMTMTLIDKKGNQRERKLISYGKNYDNGDRKALLIFAAPADVKGTSFLVWSSKDKEDQQWLYMPALQRVRQITSSGKGESFMGTEFSFYDMGKHKIDDNDYKLLKEEAIDSQMCYVIESIPKHIEYYSKVISWIRKDNFLPAKMDFYDRKEQYLKQGLFGKIQNIKGIATPTHIEMKNLQNGKATILDFSNIRHDSGLSEEIFTQRYMQRGK
jgi:outer membrane lipoprotein-sorting protein